MTGTKVGVRQTELPMLRAYRLWFEHARKCAHCKRVRTARDGCLDGQELWASYRRAYDGGGAE
ncbi:hypothetical protein PV396_38425 [Streptomyces sp. ME02-8801-2C]|uniref:hypothetical protein n=1 Tax=Streptomyces sp. ME02-8801-2C TaxID=3028680 RepID=UPI0029A85C93|nr:hypothetical protein [Streptomyces sp. ME02-8801-2C]MDX3457763.1 hypothetical protein [Streptomyces sp. ME02-8801-2C]